MIIENETIKALQRNLARVKENQDIFVRAKVIANNGGTLEQMIALGVHRDMAIGLMNPQSVIYTGQNMAVSQRNVIRIEKKLAAEIEKEKQRRNKKGI